MPFQNLARRLLGVYIRKYIYLPEQLPAVSGQYGACRFEKIEVKTADNLTLAGLRSIPEVPVRYTLLYLHGNGGCAATRAELVSPLCADGADIIVVDYRGYGHNPGQPTEVGLMKDAEAFRDFAVHTSDKPIVVFGHSLGGAIAIVLASRVPPKFDGIITLGTFASLKLRAPSYVRNILPDTYDAMAYASQISIPWIIAHEEADEVTSVAHASVLYESSGEPDNVKLSIMRNGNHSLDAAKLGSHIEHILNFEEKVAAK